jgi:hypothetical protein
MGVTTLRIGDLFVDGCRGQRKRELYFILRVVESRTDNAEISTFETCGLNPWLKSALPGELKLNGLCES